MLGIEVPTDKFVDILQKLEFAPIVNGDELTLTIPLYRNDVESYQDIAEEIIRMYGYDNITNTLLDNASITVGGLNKEQKDIETAKNCLVAQGFNEIVTYSFVSEKDFDNFNIDKQSDRYKFVKIFNPLGEDLSVMRTLLLPSMVKVVATNLNKKNLSGRLFEFAKEYCPKSLPLTELPNENLCLSLAVFGENEDFFTLKGVVENLLESIHASFKVDYRKCERAYMHPTKSAEIFFGNTSIGFIGELNPEVAENMGIDKRIYVGEIEYYKISPMLNKKLLFKAFGKYPSVERDIALVCDKKVTNGEIIRVIKKSCDKSLVQVELFDIYEGDKIQDGKKSLAYHLVFNLLDRSLTQEEVDKNVNKILQEVAKLGVELR